MDQTLHTVGTSIRLMMNIEEEGSFFDLAAALERRARERGLDRLLTLCQEGSSL